MDKNYSFNTAINANSGSGETFNYKHLNTIWRVSTSESVDGFGAVDMSFDISHWPKLSGCYPLELVVGGDNYNYSGSSSNQYDSVFSNPENVYPLTILGDVAFVNGVNIENKRHFTLRYREELITWDGKSFIGGSGVAGAPGETDSEKKLIILANTTVVLNAKAHVCEIEVQTGAELIINNGSLLEVETKIHNDGLITVNGESQVIQKHTGTGAFTVTQKGSSNLYNYNYWRSPVNRSGAWQVGYLENNSGVAFNFAYQNDANPSTTPMTLSSRWLYTFNGEDENYYAWHYVGENTDILPGTGYTMKGSGASTAEQGYMFKGKSNNGDYSYPIAVGDEFLVGNP